MVRLPRRATFFGSSERAQGAHHAFIDAMVLGGYFDRIGEKLYLKMQALCYGKTLNLSRK
jgi:hypothetical protein